MRAHFTADGRQVDRAHVQGITDKLSAVPLFAQVKDGEFFKLLSLELKPLRVPVGSLVIERGEVGHEMFFLTSGEVEVLISLDKPAVTTLREGVSFGETALMSEEPRNAYIRASVGAGGVDHVDLYVLSKEGLQRTLLSFPEVEDALEEEALQRRQELAAQAGDGATASDSTAGTHPAAAAAVSEPEPEPEPAGDSSTQMQSWLLTHVGSEGPAFADAVTASFVAAGYAPEEYIPTLASMGLPELNGFVNAVQEHYTADGRQVDRAHVQGITDKLSAVPLFAQVKDGEFFKLLSLELKPLRVPVGSLVIERGEVGHEMFFLTSGEVEVLISLDKPAVTTLREGVSFGETALMSEEPRNAYIRASVGAGGVDHVDLYVLSKEGLQRTLLSFPEVEDALEEEAFQRRSQLGQAERRMSLPSATEVVASSEPAESATEQVFTLQKGKKGFGMQIEPDGRISAFAPSSVAESAGVQLGMRVRAVNGYTCLSKSDVVAVVSDPTKCSAGEVKFTFSTFLSGASPVPGATSATAQGREDPSGEATVLREELAQLHSKCAELEAAARSQEATRQVEVEKLTAEHSVVHAQALAKSDLQAQSAGGDQAAVAAVEEQSRLHAEVETVRQELAASKAEVSTLMDERVALIETAKTLVFDVTANAENVHADLAAKHETAQRELSESTASSSALRAELSQTVDALHAELSQAAESHQAATANLKSEMDAARGVLVAEYTATQNAAAVHLDAAKTSHAQQVEEARRRHAELNDSLSKLQEECTHTELLHSEAERKASSLAEDLQSKQTELDALSGDASSKDAAAANKDEALARAREQADKHFSHLEDLKESSARELATLRGQLSASAERARSDVQAQGEASATTIQQLQVEIQALVAPHADKMQTTETAHDVALGAAIALVESATGEAGSVEAELKQQLAATQDALDAEMAQATAAKEMAKATEAAMFAKVAAAAEAHVAELGQTAASHEAATARLRSEMQALVASHADKMQTTETAHDVALGAAIALVESATGEAGSVEAELKQQLAATQDALDAEMAQATAAKEMAKATEAAMSAKVAAAAEAGVAMSAKAVSAAEARAKLEAQLSETTSALGELVADHMALRAARDSLQAEAESPVAVAPVAAKVVAPSTPRIGETLGAVPASPAAQRTSSPESPAAAAVAGNPGLEFAARVTQATTPGVEHTTYLVELFKGGAMLASVVRRFSEFDQLRRELCAGDGKTSAISLLHFPPKMSLRGKKSSHVIQRRQADLQAWLNAALRISKRPSARGKLLAWFRLEASSPDAAARRSGSVSSPGSVGSPGGGTTPRRL